MKFPGLAFVHSQWFNNDTSFSEGQVSKLFSLL